MADCAARETTKKQRAKIKCLCMRNSIKGSDDAFYCSSLEKLHHGKFGEAKKLISIAAYLPNINHQLVKTSIVTLSAISAEKSRDEA